MKAKRRSKSKTGKMYAAEGIVPLVVTRGVFFLAEPSVNKNGSLSVLSMYS